MARLFSASWSPPGWRSCVDARGAIPALLCGMWRHPHFPFQAGFGARMRPTTTAARRTQSMCVHGPRCRLRGEEVKVINEAQEDDSLCR